MVVVEVEVCELAQRAELDGNRAGEVVVVELWGKFVARGGAWAYCSQSGRAPHARLEPLQLGEVAEAAGDRPREVVCVEVEVCELAQRAELDGNGAGEVVILELGGES